MRIVPKRWKQRNPDMIRHTLRWLEGLGELARVTLPSGVSFVGHPHLVGPYVVLKLDDGSTKDVVRVNKIGAVSRAQWARPGRMIRDEAIAPTEDVKPV